MRLERFLLKCPSKVRIPYRLHEVASQPMLVQMVQQHVCTGRAVVDKLVMIARRTG